MMTTLNRRTLKKPSGNMDKRYFCPRESKEDDPYAAVRHLYYRTCRDCGKEDTFDGFKSSTYVCKKCHVQRTETKRKERVKAMREKYDRILMAKYGTTEF